VNALPLSLVVKGTLLLSLALLVMPLLRRRSAAARHLAWSWSLRALLVLPLLALLLPSWRLPVAAPRGGTSTPSIMRVASPVAAHVAADIAAPGRSAEDAPAALTQRAMATMPVRQAFLPALLLVAWAGLATILIIRLAAGAIRLRRMARAATPVVDEGWTTSLAAVAEELALRVRPRLLVSREVGGPCVLGIGSPVLLLPPDARSWDAARRRAVLLHELSHVARRDQLDILLSRVAVAAWWFHPLAWMAERRCRIERERACDDAVLRAGSAPGGYAQQLVDLASRGGGMPMAALSAMAQRSGLEERVRAVLDGKVERRALRRGVLVPVVLLTCTAILASADPAKPTASRDALVFTVETGMRPDAGAFAKHVGPSARVAHGGVEWQRGLHDYADLDWPRYLVLADDWFTSFPASVRIHCILEADGRLTVGASGPVPDVLGVLADGGIGTPVGWGEAMLPAGRRLSHGLLGLDERSNVLAFLAYGEMLSAAEAGVVKGGPELAISTVRGSDEGHFLRDFDVLPSQLENHLGQPITVAQAALFVAQPSTKFAYGAAVDGMAFTEAPFWPVYAALNDRWDPWGNADEDGIRVRRLSVDWQGVDHSFVSVRAHGDNGNSGHVRLDGRIVKAYSKWDESANAVRLADARPQHAELAMSARWSVSTTSLRAVALGGSLGVSIEDEPIQADVLIIPPS